MAANWLGSGGFTLGFVIGAGDPKKVLIRAVGPTLRNFNVPNAAPQTTLTVYSGQTVLATNSGWNTAANSAQMTAFGGTFSLPVGSGDSAVLVTLPAGSYTAAATANGAVLLEAYEVP